MLTTLINGMIFHDQLTTNSRFEGSEKDDKRGCRSLPMLAPTFFSVLHFRQHVRQTDPGIWTWELWMAACIGLGSEKGAVSRPRRIPTDVQESQAEPLPSSCKLRQSAWLSASLFHDYYYFRTNKSCSHLGHDIQT